MYVHVIVAGIGVSFKIYPPPPKKNPQKNTPTKKLHKIKILHDLHAYG